ncbi:MAG: DUF4783 domain-containing protein [Bacteroidetes bacterium]|nr:DUF4783 domain-containing protein [Bacteroidota bacterium]MBS1608922.1 DUF4783 domain-containing protein [Bacteroidota bacterium]
MKTKFTILLLTPVFLLFSFTMQGGIDEVIGALKTGSVSELSKYIEDNVEITLPDKSDNYSKAQSVLVLKDFFSNSGVKSFDVKHKGDGPSGQFCVGTLVTKNGNYRTNVFMKVKGNKQIMKEIRFQSVE